MKEYPETISLQEVWYHFEGYPLAHVATIEENHPRVRPMALITHGNDLWLASKTEWDKVVQIKKNNRVEFTVAPTSETGSGSLRITARAIIVVDIAIKAEVLPSIPWFNQYWYGVDDPNFTLIRLDLHRILYDHPTDKKKYTVSLT